MKERLTSRKLLFALLLLAISSACLFMKHYEFQDWADFAKWIFGIYAAGNVGSEAAKVLNNNPEKVN